MIIPTSGRSCQSRLSAQLLYTSVVVVLSIVVCLVQISYLITIISYHHHLRCHHHQYHHLHDNIITVIIAYLSCEQVRLTGTSTRLPATSSGEDLLGHNDILFFRSSHYVHLPQKKRCDLCHRNTMQYSQSILWCIVMQCQGKRLLCQVQPLSSQQEMDHHHHYRCLFCCSKGSSLDFLTIIQLHNQGCKKPHSFSVADIGSRILLK